MSGSCPPRVSDQNLRVGPVLDHRGRLGIAAEEMLADIGAVLRAEVLVFAVDAFLHQLAQLALGVLGEQLVPAGAPQAFDHVPAGAAEAAFQLLHDLAVAAHWPVEPLQVAVDDKDEVVELFPAGERHRAQRLRLVHLAVAAEHPDLAARGVGEAATVQVAQKARLIDRHQRPEAHRHGRELPEVGHQPGMGVGRQALAADFLAEIDKLLLRQPPFDEGARVDARRAVALDVNQVAAVSLGVGVPEMHEAGVVEGGGRLEACDVAAELGGFLVGLDHDRGGVPADIAPDRHFDLAVAGMRRLGFRRDGVDVGRVGRERQARALAPGGGDDLVEDCVDLADTFERLYGIERVEPLVGFVVDGSRPVIHRVGLPGSSDNNATTKVDACLCRSLLSCATEIRNRPGQRCSHV